MASSVRCTTSQPFISVMTFLAVTVPSDTDWSSPHTPTLSLPWWSARAVPALRLPASRAAVNRERVLLCLFMGSLHTVDWPPPGYKLGRVIGCTEICLG